MSFLGEIKRRKVFQVAAVYAVVGWLIVQIVDVVNEPLNLPPWMDTFVIVLVIVGFPLALVLSWAYDLTPSGVVRTGAMPESDANTLSAISVEERIQRERLPNSVAVLPFENLSPDPDNAYFAAGIHEAVLSELAKVRDLNVIARTSVLRYADGQKSIPEIASELNVETVMEGSVQYADAHVRITAQLISSESGVHLWSETYDREFADIFAIQTDIATRIAEALAAELTPHERRSIERGPTESLDAYSLYLKARATIGNVTNAETVPDASARFHAYLDRALEIDPGFPLAHAIKAVDYATSLVRSVRVSDELSAADRTRLAEQHAKSALALDSNLGLAHDALAQAHRYNWRLREAREAFERALQLSPNDPQILHHFATFNAMSKNVEEAIELERRRVELNPYVAVVLMAFIRLFSRDYETVRAAADEAIARNPADYGSYVYRGLAQGILGNEGGALADLRLADTLMPDSFVSPAELAFFAYAYRRIEQLKDAQRLFDRVKAMAADYRIGAGNWALLYLAIGDEEQAFDWLKRAGENRVADAGYINLGQIALNVFREPTLEKPAFVELRNRLGFSE